MSEVQALERLPGAGRAQRAILDLAEHWYPAVASTQLGKRPAAARVLSHDLVLFRNADGTPAALLDRCPHRGVALSQGDCAEGTVRCRYHGWRFGADGRCVEVPSLVKGAQLPQVTVPTFPCVEQDGYIWVWTGDNVPAEGPARIRPFRAHGWYQGSLDMQCSAMSAIENNLDVAHPSFAHPGTHPQYLLGRLFGRVTGKIEVRTDANGVCVQAAGYPEGERGPLSSRFDLPGRVIVDLNYGLRFLLVLHFVPTSTSTCRMEWLSRRPWGRPGSVKWMNDTPLVFRQDQRLMESAQKWYDADGGAFERSAPADAAQLAARRLVCRAARAAEPEPLEPRSQTIAARL